MFRKLFSRSKTQPGNSNWAALDWVFDGQTRCTCCGETGTTLLSLAYDRPDPFPNDAPKLPNSALPGADGDILTEDFCLLGDAHIVRCVMEFPLIGREENLLLGVWGSLAPQNFDTYCEHFDDRRTHELEPAFSWLCNAIPPQKQKSDPVKCSMVFRDEAQRPILIVSDETHPLFDTQHTGLTPDTLAFWLAAYGHTGPRVS